MLLTRFSIALCIMAVLGVDERLFASPASSLMKSVARYVSREAAEEGAEKMTREIGENVVERVAVRLAREGGEESVERASQLVARHGPDVIRAIDNAPDAKAVLNALDELPLNEIPVAASRLAAGKHGRELAKATKELGVGALRAEVKHPGVGSRFVRAWGEDGASLCGQLTRDQAVVLGKHVDSLASVPTSQRSRLLAIINRDKDRFFRWLGRFVENNPGKTIGSATFLAVFLPNADRILGDSEIVFDENGKPSVVHKPGLLAAPVNQLTNEAKIGVSWLSRGLAIVAILAVALYASTKLWGVWRREFR